MSENGEDELMEDYYDEEEEVPVKPKRGGLSFKKVQPVSFVASGVQKPEPERQEHKFEVKFKEKKKEPTTLPLRFKTPGSAPKKSEE